MCVSTWPSPFAFLPFLRLDTGSSKRLKIGKAALFMKGLSDYVSLQVALWCGGRAAAAQEVGISKCCQALPAAAQSRAFVLSFVKDLEDVSSTVESAMVRCQVMNSGFRRVRRADISGVLGLRFDEALKPHREGVGGIGAILCPGPEWFFFIVFYETR